MSEVTQLVFSILILITVIYKLFEYSKSSFKFSVRNLPLFFEPDKNTARTQGSTNDGLAALTISGDEDDLTMAPQTDYILHILSSNDQRIRPAKRTFHLVDGTTSLGRAPSREERVERITLAGDNAISREHLYIERTDDEHFTIFDRGSRFGTRVNGTRIQSKTKVPLKANDEIQVGNTTLVLSTKESLSSDAILRVTVDPEYQLRIVKGPDVGLTQPLNGKSIVIGRGDESNWRLTDSRMSRSHVKVKMESQHLIVEDLNSTHGVWINGRKSPQRTTMKPGNIMKIGASEIKLESIEK